MSNGQDSWINKLLDRLMAELFKAETRRLQRMITDLNRTNREISGGQAHAFIYNGEVYVASDTQQIPQRGTIPPLVPSLQFAMEDYLADRKVIEADRAQIRQVMFTVLYQCKDNQEIRDSLPDCLVQLFPDLRAMPRHLEQGFIIRHTPRVLRQYEKVLPKIEFYSATRLLY